MHKRLLFLTPHHISGSRHTRWDIVLDRYQIALGDLMVTCSSQPWSLPIDGDYDLICPLVVWGYHEEAQAFRAVCQEIKSRGLRMLNPPDIIAWNVDKHYLRDLADDGVRIIPTVFCPSIDQDALRAARADFGQLSLVIKPTISAGAKDTFICDDDDLSRAATGAVMIQPFMQSIQSEGEWSLLFLGGVFSHAILKTPKAGDFRSQPDYDARLQTLAPPEDALDLAYQALDYVGRDHLLYARVDMVRDHEGRFCLMELELIEPDLYLGYDEHAPAQFTHAFKHALGLCEGH